MRYLWAEDTGAGLHFWKLVNRLFSDNELVVESKGSNQGLLDALIDLDIKDDDKYYIASGIVDALDDKEYTGSLVTLLQDGTDFVRNNSKKAWRKVGDGRIEMPDYPDRAVLEGVVNALIHRNYMEIGSEVHIDMFDDRIEIYSPGGMVSEISLEGKDLLKIPSKLRNPILADIFSRLKYMERRGSGFKKTLADYEGQVEFDETNMRQRRFKIMDISKKDWKLFRERLSGWQENYMEGLVKEYANFLNDDKKPASEKFWELEKRIKEDKRHPGVIMEMSKSEAIWDIVRLIRLKVITYDDLSDFSDELQNEVKRILEMSR